MMFVFAFLAGLVAADTTDHAGSGLAVSPEGVAPASVVVHHQPAIPIVALRMSLLVSDPPGFAGAGHLIQHLVYPRLREQVRRVGGQAQIQRSSDALVYTVIGPAAELEYLSDALRSVLSPPIATVGEMVVAMRALEEERLAEWETAASHIRAEMRSRLFPQDLPAPGTAASAARLEARLLRPIWAEIYQPQRVSVIAVGDVRLDEVRRVFAELPPPPRERLGESYTDTVPVARLAPAEATRGWMGLGYSAARMDPVALTVTARLLSDDLRSRLPTAGVEVEHWWTHHGQALAVVVAAPEASIPLARRTLGTALTALRQELTEGQVRAAATAVRREMLFYARTPDRMAEVVGRFTDRDGDPDAAQQFFTDLEVVRLADVQQVIDRLAERTPVRVDIAPQALDRRP